MPSRSRVPLVGGSASAARFALGFLLGVLVRVWVFTLRVRVTIPLEFGETPARVVCFWHGHQMALLGARRLLRGAVVLVSRSKDGDVQTGVMTALGFRVVRGSSSRGGARALSALIAHLHSERPAALSIDGPRGPRHVAKPGALAAARASDAPLYPVASAARSALVLERTWDRFEIPLPFTRVSVVVGSRIESVEPRSELGLVGDAISACRSRAEQSVGSRALVAATTAEG